MVVSTEWHRYFCLCPTSSDERQNTAKKLYESLSRAARRTAAQSENDFRRSRYFQQSRKNNAASRFAASFPKNVANRH
jgi:hypothetical protein